jgi:hypothetical protein
MIILITGETVTLTNLDQLKELNLKFKFRYKIGKDLYTDKPKKIDNKYYINLDSTLVNENDIISLYEKCQKRFDYNIRFFRFCQLIDGGFSFILHTPYTKNDGMLKKSREILVVRDPLGIRPLYYSISKCRRYIIFILMEINELNINVDDFIEFPPGYFWSYSENKLISYTNKLNYFSKQLNFNNFEQIKTLIQNLIFNSFKKIIYKNQNSDKCNILLILGNDDEKKSVIKIIKSITNKNIILLKKKNKFNEKLIINKCNSKKIDLIISDIGYDELLVNINLNDIRNIYKNVLMRKINLLASKLHIISHYPFLDITLVKTIFDINPIWKSKINFEFRFKK